MQQQNLIKGVPTVAAATGKLGRGSTPRRSSEDPGAARFVSAQPNLTGDRVMRYAFRPLKYWPDNGDAGLAVAFYFFQKLGCLTVASDRVLHGIYQCLAEFPAQELREAIDEKAASLGETFAARQQKLTYVPQPENFFNPESPLLRKWLAKSPARRKRLQDEARATVAQTSPSVLSERQERAHAAADSHAAAIDRRRIDAAAAARKAAAWHEFTWAALSPDEQNTALARVAPRVQEECNRHDLTPKEVEQLMREQARAAGSATLLLHHKPRHADLRRQFEAQYAEAAP